MNEFKRREHIEQHLDKILRAKHFDSDERDIDFMERDHTLDVNTVTYPCGCLEQYNAYFLQINSIICEKHKPELLDYLYGEE